MILLASSADSLSLTSLASYTYRRNTFLDRVINYSASKRSRQLAEIVTTAEPKPYDKHAFEALAAVVAAKVMRASGQSY
ncbi:hypothetical protein QMK19_40140 [Streptomyces sp. H10-C2]|uniref:hypothetical protein n=1 Tax=unclassified Streptomyces TaxID=2593676 RepID=UPI0024BA9D58|nr:MULTISPECIES: hypothetical protein [unclassified Streptomyces]MDJ0347386.1 hypothetical protein [Streptomyces sp. PH10-H1]MDJ0375628.1 hypothetical protein [Streptomyces sp. H10-C2]